MTTAELQSYLRDKITKLPPEKLEKLKETIDELSQEEPPKLEKRQFGSMKGFLKYMAPDFDEPLEDFKDYM